LSVAPAFIKQGMQPELKVKVKVCCMLPRGCFVQVPDTEHDPLSKGMLAWASPLQHDWSASSAPRQVNLNAADQDNRSSGYAAMGGAATAAAGLVAAATAVAAAAQPPPASALSLAMRLVEGSQAAGITGRGGQGIKAPRGDLETAGLRSMRWLL
jgi:hypothetical protein